MGKKGWLAFLKRTKKLSSKNPNLLPFLSEVLKIQPNNIRLYEEAFTHKSTAQKNSSGRKLSYERLEFLGDAIIGAVVSEYVYLKYPQKEEGFLTQLKAKVVSRKNLNQIAEKLNLEPIISYKRKNSAHKSLLGNVLEALSGAIYLDQGYEKTKEIIITKFLNPFVNLENLAQQNFDFKSKLLNYCQVNKIDLKYEMINEEQRGSFINFTMGVYLNNELKAFSTANSKREAEQNAAKKTLIQVESESKK